MLRRFLIALACMVFSVPALAQGTPSAAQPPNTRDVPQGKDASQGKDAPQGKSRQSALPPPHTTGTSQEKAQFTENWLHTVLQKLTIQAEPKSPAPNQPVEFTVAASVPLYRRTFVFDWGDDHFDQSDKPAASHIYAAPGAYKIRVMAKSVASEEIAPYAGETTINVRGLALTADPPNARAGDAVRLIATLNPKDESAQYSFDFGDGSRYDSGTKNETPPHSYSKAGAFHPTVVAVFPQSNESVTGSLPLTIAAVPRKLALAVKPEHARVGDQVEFTATLDPPDPSARYRFSFGDRDSIDSGSQSRVLYEYKQEGNFRASVAVLLGGNETVQGNAIEVTIAPSRPRDAPTPSSEASSGSEQTRPSHPSTDGKTAWRYQRYLWAALALLLVTGLIVRYRARRRRPQLRLVPCPDAGVHGMAHIQPSGPYVSVKLKPGMKPGAARITFRKSATGE